MAVDEESLPLHIVTKGPHAREVAVARFVLERPELRRTYEQWLFTLHEKAWKEARSMSRVVDDEIEIDVRKVWK